MQAWPTIVSVLADDGNRPMMRGLCYLCLEACVLYFQSNLLFEPGHITSFVQPVVIIVFLA